MKHITFKRHYIIVCLIAVALFGAAAFAAIALKFFNSSAQGTIKQPAATQNKIQEKTAKLKFLQQTGKEISFKYPAVYSLNPERQIAVKSGEQFILTNDSPNNSGKIVVAVSGYTKLEELSAYQLRKQSSAVYEPWQVDIAGDPATGFKAKDGREAIIFVPHQGLVAIVAGTAMSSETIASDVMATVQSISWR